MLAFHNTWLNECHSGIHFIYTRASEGRRPWLSANCILYWLVYFSTWIDSVTYFHGCCDLEARWNIIMEGKKILKLENFIFVITFNLFQQKIKGAFRPTPNWGPRDASLNAKYKEFINSTDWSHSKAQDKQKDVDSDHVCLIMFYFRY